MQPVLSSTPASWQGQAACRFADPELFFPVSSAGPARDQAERAKAVCATCLVRPQCLGYALAANEEHGVWGGMTEEERARSVGRACGWAAN